MSRRASAFAVTFRLFPSSATAAKICQDLPSNEGHAGRVGDVGGVGGVRHDRLPQVALSITFACSARNLGIKWSKLQSCMHR